MTAESEAEISAATPEEFVAALRRLRTRVGDPSFRQLSKVAERRAAAAPAGKAPELLPPSTTSEILAGRRLPRLPRREFVEAYVAACLCASGAAEAVITAEVARWRQMWHTLADPEDVPERAGSRRPYRTGVVVVAVFLAGTAVGAQGIRWWDARTPAAGAVAAPPAVAGSPDPGSPGAGSPDADRCAEPGAADPSGRDVLGVAAAPDAWWSSHATAIRLDAAGAGFEATVSGGTAQPGDLLVAKKDVTLVEGRGYGLAFTADADHATTIRVRVQEGEGPLYYPSFMRDVAVDESGCRHVYRFTAARSNPLSELTFQFGGHPEDVTVRLSGVMLVEGV
ncbi:hypothetical protein AB0C07_21940 [Actinoplanes missouriensis]|uniref:hypothetical protein n=1 Tax=Actinoplanes missouriensis TaxID=1866 RepID=UPI0033CE1690